MNPTVVLIIEIASFIAIFLLCLHGAYATFKHSKTVPGADLIFLGLLLYGLYALLAVTGSGFTESYFGNFSAIGTLNSANFMYFLSCVLRLGLILVVIGLLRVARNLKA
jgi:hypothetical protein